MDTAWSVAVGAWLTAETVVEISVVEVVSGVQLAVKVPSRPASALAVMLVGTFHSTVRAGPATVVVTDTSGTVGVGALPPSGTDPFSVAVRTPPATAQVWVASRS